MRKAALKFLWSFLRVVNFLSCLARRPPLPTRGKPVSGSYWVRREPTEQAGYIIRDIYLRWYFAIPIHGLRDGRIRLLAVLAVVLLVMPFFCRKSGESGSVAEIEIDPFHYPIH